MADRNKKLLKNRIVYVLGAGFSAGLGFPTIAQLLPKMWPLIRKEGLEADLKRVIEFHHPLFDSEVETSFPTIERLLSDIDANIDLYNDSRHEEGTFTEAKLVRVRENLLQLLAAWFQKIQDEALQAPPLG